MMKQINLYVITKILTRNMFCVTNTKHLILIVIWNRTHGKQIILMISVVLNAIVNQSYVYFPMLQYCLVSGFNNTVSRGSRILRAIVSKPVYFIIQSPCLKINSEFWVLSLKTTGIVHHTTIIQVNYCMTASCNVCVSCARAHTHTHTLTHI